VPGTQRDLDNFAYTPMVGADAERIMSQLRADLPELGVLRFYLAGTPALVDELARSLAAAGVSMERIRPEPI
jgi:hypothetical protein